MKTTIVRLDKISILFQNGTREEKFSPLTLKISVSNAVKFIPFPYLEEKCFKKPLFTKDIKNQQVMLNSSAYLKQHRWRKKKKKNIQNSSDQDNFIAGYIVSRENL